MTLVTFSDGQLSVELPKGWHELSQPELLAVYRLMALFSAKELPFEVFRELTGMELVRINGDKYSSGCRHWRMIARSGCLQR